MPKNTHTPCTAFATKCVLAGVACAFIIFLIWEYGASETLASTFLINKTYAAESCSSWNLGCWLIWLFLKFINLLIAFLVVSIKLFVWAVYQAIVLITSVLLVYIAIPLVQHTLSPSEGTIAWHLFFRPETQNAIRDNLWVVSRDIVNVLLAILLLIGAILTIIKANKEFLSQYAPKFLMVLILVNFSWFIPRVIIDVSTVFTKTVTGIAGPCIPSPSRSCRTITGIAITLGATDNCPTVLTCMRYDQIQGPGAARVMGGLTSLYGEILMKGARFVSGPNFLQEIFLDPFQKAFSDSSGLLGLLSGILEFILTLTLVAVGAILYTAAVATLALIFLVRILVLWLTMGFMPFAMLGFVVPSLRSWTIEKIWNPFLGAAFVPVLASVPLTAGYILLNAMPPYTLTLPNSSKPFMAIFADLLPTAMAIGVIWIGVFAAIGAFKFAGSLQEGITTKMQKGGQALGKMGAYGVGAAAPALGLGYGVAALGRVQGGLGLAGKALQGKGGALGVVGTVLQKIGGGSSVGMKKLGAHLRALPRTAIEYGEKINPERMWENIKTGKGPFGGKAMTDSQGAGAANELKNNPLLNERFNKTMKTLGNKDASEEEAKKAGEEFEKILDVLARKVGDFDRSTPEQKADAVHKIISMDPSVVDGTPPLKEHLLNNLKRLAPAGGTAGSTPAPPPPPPPPPPLPPMLPEREIRLPPPFPEGETR